MISSDVSMFLMIILLVKGEKPDEPNNFLSKSHKFPTTSIDGHNFYIFFLEEKNRKYI